MTRRPKRFSPETPSVIALNDDDTQLLGRHAFFPPLSLYAHQTGAETGERWKYNIRSSLSSAFDSDQNLFVRVYNMFSTVRNRT